MNSHKKVQTGYSMPLGVNHYGAAHSSLIAERIALVELLHQHLATATELHRYVRSLEFRARSVTFVDVRHMFHRIAEATEQCKVFLAERIHDLAPAAPSQGASMAESVLPAWHELSFAACVQQIGLCTTALSQFAAQSKIFMDKAVINGDYNSLHLMTDCIYQISQLVALIQIHLPAESPSSATTESHSLI